jgi:hypothetical protein
MAIGLMPTQKQLNMGIRPAMFVAYVSVRNGTVRIRFVSLIHRVSGSSAVALLGIRSATVLQSGTFVRHESRMTVTMCRSFESACGA